MWPGGTGAADRLTPSFLELPVPAPQPRCEARPFRKLQPIISRGHHGTDGPQQNVPGSLANADGMESEMQRWKALSKPLSPSAQRGAGRGFPQATQWTLVLEPNSPQEDLDPGFLPALTGKNWARKGSHPNPSPNTEAE